MALDLATVDLKKLIDRRHPDYEGALAQWDFCKLAFLGGREWMTEENLFKFYKEGASEYKERKDRTYRENHVKRVIDTINQFLFKQKPMRSEKAPELLRKFWKKASRDGKSMDRFALELDQWQSVYGMFFVVVDRPTVAADLRKDEKLPYAYIVPPQNLLDMSYDDQGEFNWVLILEKQRVDDNPMAESAINSRFRLWTRDEWILFGLDEKNEPMYIARNAHNLGVVPVVKVASDVSCRYSSPALIGDIVYMDRALVNYGSMLDEILYQQTFSQLTLPAEAVLPGTAEMGQIIAASKQRVFLYNGLAGGKPEFISPDASQARLIIEAMDRTMKNIYAVSGTDHEANSQSMSAGKSYASGKARQYDYSAIENILVAKSVAIEQAEEQIAALVLKWMGDNTEIDTAWVQYPEKFDIRGLTAELDMALELWKTTPPVEMARKHMKVINDKMFTRQSDVERDTMHAAIDKWTPDYSVALNIEQQVADDGTKIADATVMSAEAAVEAANKTENAEPKDEAK